MKLLLKISQVYYKNNTFSLYNRIINEVGICHIYKNNYCLNISNSPVNYIT